MITSATAFDSIPNEICTSILNETQQRPTCFSFLSFLIFILCFIVFGVLWSICLVTAGCRICCYIYWVFFLYLLLCIGGICRGACRLNDRQILHMFKYTNCNFVVFFSFSFVWAPCTEWVQRICAAQLNQIKPNIFVWLRKVRHVSRDQIYLLVGW